MSRGRSLRGRAGDFREAQAGFGFIVRIRETFPVTPGSIEIVVVGPGDGKGVAARCLTDNRVGRGPLEVGNDGAGWVRRASRGNR